ncbi:MAG: class I SAM-dependent methyltransferase [Spirochaetes bacterium]|nr:class I SAM-dependent methyltransferase [Spirochaetota bacterium]
MFNEISSEMKARMHFLEQIDASDRKDGTDRMNRLRQIPPETGKFIALMASQCPRGDIVEIGTSAGYSTMWLSLAAKELQTKVRTFELLPEKAALARETFILSGIESLVVLTEGDALMHLSALDDIAFCFIDCEKAMYEACWNIVADKILPRGVLIADNAINHYDALQSMIEKVMADDRFDSIIVPIGKGELVCRRKMSV